MKNSITEKLLYKGKNLDSFCSNFYEEYIINPKIGEIDVSNVYPEQVKKTIVEVCEQFNQVDVETLKYELIFMRFEIFALAFQHKLGFELAAYLSMFTVVWLQENHYDSIWFGMFDYNQAVYKAVNVGADKSLYPKMAKLDELIKMRLTELDKFTVEAKKQGIDIEKEEFFGSTNYVMHRLYSTTPWEKDDIAYYLIGVLWYRLGLVTTPNQETVFRLVGYIRGIYQGSLEVIEANCETGDRGNEADD